ncbi:homoserine dehydrogenase [Tissierella carlieri]|jgi:homoserine dehydrogenase|uniref:homoserine dehydrogenase n=1 Tax=Tissierella carlieri TaxID=689904 RepID=UPI001C0FBDD6|nr:homoserine dehydrogenase [Tissierella carlieri]MBU5312676.1 homoserine dehydrogenase [Tissierella carlieri]
MINIGLLGLGTVGLGIVEILDKRKDELKAILGSELRIKKILVKNNSKKRSIDIEREMIVTDFEDILEDEDISIIIEVTSDLENSYKYIKKALNAGKHVVTANKAVVSKYFEELSSLASEKKLAFLYEASVGGGIPILKPLREQTAINEITKVQGILNGTCNYILTRMFEEGMDYEDTLKIAKELGYAEVDPTADVEGYDTLRKLRILGTIALRGKISEEDMILDGISSITAFDMEQIKNMNSTVKLIGEVNMEDGKFTAVVQPTIINKDSYFSKVNMAYNSIVLIGDNVGELRFYGSGAGALPTADAVLGDVIDVVNNSYGKINPLGKRKVQNNNLMIKDKYYLRISEMEKEDISKLRKIAEKILTTSENFAVITKKVFLKDILDLIKSLGLRKDKYFLGRILN